MYNKQFKDPIYGYIEIDAGIVSNIIDTPAFQRLKDIRQTSYTPLFPAAYHNRYVHSLGVYHLGRIAFQAIKPQLIEKSENTKIHDHISKISEIFELACLLHDIGHAPFSHTGETFFLNKDLTLYNELKTCVDEAGFASDFDALGTKKPAPHECMSCIVGLSKFSDFFTSSKERSLFARCIIGMPIRFSKEMPDNEPTMSEDEKKEITRQRNIIKSRITALELLNCVISLLNSSIIDVDRLDYIIRDAATIGFKNVQVDYMRLLNGMRIVQYCKSYIVGYHKSALSVIESTVYAHDAEKKWIQSHPAILYEMEALKSAMSKLNSIFCSEDDPNPLFCYEALTEEGKNLSLYSPLLTFEANKLHEKNELFTEAAVDLWNANNLFESNLILKNDMLMIKRDFPILLLADEDILHLMKCFCRDSLGYEYFSRNNRRTAVWKSESEFRALFQERIGDDTKSIKKLENDFENLINFCQTKTGYPIVNDQILEILSTEELSARKARDNEEIDQEKFDDIIKDVETHRHWVNIFLEIARSLNIENEFLIVFQKKFTSSFKANLGDIPVLFPNLKDCVVPLKNVVDVLKPSADRKSNFFHLFYKPIGTIDESRKKEIVNKIAERLVIGTN